MSNLNKYFFGIFAAFTLSITAIAQEVEEIIPEIVKEETTGCLKVDPDNLTWYLINAVQELSAQVEELKAQINEGK